MTVLAEWGTSSSHLRVLRGEGFSEKGEGSPSCGVLGHGNACQIRCHVLSRQEPEWQHEARGQTTGRPWPSSVPEALSVCLAPQNGSSRRAGVFRPSGLWLATFTWHGRRAHCDPQVIILTLRAGLGGPRSLRFAQDQTIPEGRARVWLGAAGSQSLVSRQQVPRNGSEYLRARPAPGSLTARTEGGCGGWVPGLC